MVEVEFLPARLVVFYQAAKLLQHESGEKIHKSESLFRQLRVALVNYTSSTNLSQQQFFYEASLTKAESVMCDLFGQGLEVECTQ